MVNIAVFDDNGSVDIGIIDDFEKEVGACFPLDYKILLSKHDALSPEKNYFRYQFQGKMAQGDITFFGYGNPSDPESMSNVQQSNFTSGKTVVFGGTANGDYIVFDYQYEAKEPAIAIMLHDVFDRNGDMLLLKISNNFQAFITELDDGSGSD